MKYKLVSDDSGHQYAIPSNHLSEWYNMESDDLPPWAKRINGSFEFENPTCDGKELFDWITEHGIEMIPIDVSGKPMIHLFKNAK